MKFSQGDVHPVTCLFFRAYVAKCQDGEWWQTEKKFNAWKRRRRVYDLGYAERKKENSRRYEQRNREKRQLKNRNWYAANREGERARARAKDKKSVAAANKKWRKANPEKTRYVNARWDLNNPGSRRAHRLKARVSLTPKQAREVRNWYQFRDVLNRVHGQIVYHVDHKNPISAGGRHVPDNLQVTTAAFNLSKGRTVLGNPKKK